MNILVVDDQRSARLVLKKILRTRDDIDVVEAATLEQAKAAISEVRIDLALVDLRLKEGPDRGGLELLEWINATGRSTPCVMVTSVSEVSEVRAAMRLGAQDYVLKDELGPEMLLPIVDGLSERIMLRDEVQRLRRRMSDTLGTARLVGSSAGMAKVRKLIERVANADAVVLIRGATGTGKELVARAIHETSRRASEPFLAVNCSALPGALVESLLFGHEKGAFTGADRKVRGQLELAGGGTVLLDEIAEMPLELQAKLLRVIEDRKFRPLGSEVELPMRARLLAATHVELEERIAKSAFREDLFYRLSVVTIDLPSLDERREDVVELLHAFSKRLQRPLRFTVDAVEWLQNRRWPGNVRELENAIERVSLLTDEEEIDAATLSEIVGERYDAKVHVLDRIAEAILALPKRLGTSKLDVVERAVLHHAVESCGGNKSAAARLVGVNRKSLERKIERFSALPTDDDEAAP
jgi:DNA-binding NtrC family response regulator